MPTLELVSTVGLPCVDIMLGNRSLAQVGCRSVCAEAQSFDQALLPGRQFEIRVELLDQAEIAGRRWPAVPGQGPQTCVIPNKPT